MSDASTVFHAATGQIQELPTSGDFSRPQWIHVLPAGRFTGADGRGPYDASSPQTIIANTRKVAGKKQIPVDYDHQTDLGAKKGFSTAPAAGWITGWQIKEDGIWGLVEWTPKAAAMLKDREYRFLSPVFQHSPTNKVLALLRAGLTNDPNLELTALNNKAGSHMADAAPSFLQSLRELLELPEEAGESEILEALRSALTAKNSADPSKYVPMDVFQDAVKKIHELNVGAPREIAEVAVHEALRVGRLLPGMKNWAIQLCTVNKPAFDAFLNDTAGGAKILSFIEDLTTPRLKGRNPDHERQQAMSAEKKEVLENLGLSENDYKSYGVKK